MKTPYVVFDFDGTIANSIKPGLKVENDFVATIGLDQITEESFQELRNKTYMEIIKAFHIPLWRVPKLLLQLRTKMKENISEVHPYDYIPFVLDKLDKDGYYLYVLTSNGADVVEAFMEKHAINVFDDIFSETNIFGKGRAIKRFMKQEGIKKEDMIYIGDEVRDIEACKSNDVRIISVTWGFNSRPLLEKHKPDFMADEPRELLKIIESVT